MTKVLWSCSSVVFTVALAAGLGGAGCVAASDEAAAAEPTAVESPATPREAPSLTLPAPAAQVSFVCLDFDNGDVFGRPQATLAACQAACPAPAVCIRCVGAINDCI